MERMLSSLAAGAASSAGGPPLLSGTGKDDVHLLVVITSDRGLCGSFNVNIMRGVRQRVRALEAEGKTVNIYGVGRKGIMLARREYRSKVVEALEDASRSEEHTTELQSLMSISYAAFSLQKKKQTVY